MTDSQVDKFYELCYKTQWGEVCAEWLRRGLQNRIICGFESHLPLQYYTHRVDSMDIDTQEFKKAFWHWFDNELSQDERLKFKTYPADMAELYFYNKVWSKSKTHNAHVSPNATNVDKGNWSG